MSDADNYNKIEDAQEQSNGHTTKHGNIDEAIHEDVAEETKMVAVLSTPDDNKCHCRNILLFSIIYGILLLFKGLYEEYLSHIIEGVGAHFGFSQLEAQFVIGVGRIGFVAALLLVSFYANRVNKPRLIFTGSLIAGLASFLLMMPHFLYPTHQVFSVLCVANFVVGVGLAFISTLGLVYIDDNSQPRKSALYLGGVLCLNALGQFVGVILSYAVTSLTPEDASAITAWRAPTMVGAWWLAFPIVSGGFIIFGTFMLIFPRWFVIPDWVIADVIKERDKQKKRQIREKAAMEKCKKQLAQQNNKQKKNAKKAQTMENTKDDSSSRTGSSEITDELGQNSNDVIASNTNQPEPDEPEDDLVNLSYLELPGAKKETHSSLRDVISKYGARSMDTAGKGYDNLAANLEGEDPIFISMSTLPQRKKSKNTHVVDDTVDKRADNTEKKDKQKHSNGNPSKSHDPKHSSAASKKKKRTIQETKNRWIEKYRKRKGERLQDLLILMWRMVRHPIFLTACLGALFGTYLPGGYVQTLPTYIRTQFQQSRRAVSLTIGLSGHGATAAGCLTGGIISYKWQPSPFKKMRMVLIILVVSSVGLACLMGLGCNEAYPTGLDVTQRPMSLDRDCNADCDCERAPYYPLCSADNGFYLSPCHAGCADVHFELSPYKRLNFTGCACGQWAMEGTCSQACPLFWPYAVLLAIVMLIHSTAYVPVTIIFIRSVKEKFRSLALGFAVWLVNLFAFFPGRAVYTAIKDAACLVWRPTCSDDEVCWLHTLGQYRYLQHGVAIALQVAAFLLFCITCYRLRPSATVSEVDNKTVRYKAKPAARTSGES